MFSRYKKDAKSGKPTGAAFQGKVTELPKKSAPGVAEVTNAPTSLRRQKAAAPARSATADKDQKRKERMAELKLDLHRELLENLNLAALDTASEQDLRAEINEITNEVLNQKAVVLNREDRTQLNQELYFEVKGLGPLETLLQ